MKSWGSGQLNCCGSQSPLAASMHAIEIQVASLTSMQLPITYLFKQFVELVASSNLDSRDNISTMRLHALESGLACMKVLCARVVIVDAMEWLHRHLDYAWCLKLSELNVKLSEINQDHQASPVTTPTEQESECTVREQDRYMPIANVIRIMRKILPPHAKISDDAKETIQECVSEYISFVTGEANERCQREQRKTITAEDVLWAMSKLGFDDYIEPLTLYLHHYREMEGVKRTADYGGGGGLGLSTAFHLGHNRHGFLGYLKDSPSSQSAMPKEELHPQPAGYK